MKKKIIKLCILFISSFSYAQVGINNTNPKAQVDITASSISAPNANDGLLIPRVTAFPTAVTSDQNGMLIFLTTAFASNKSGFYYYDFPSLTWKWLAAGNNISPWVNNNANSRIEVPFQSDGITPRPLGNEAVILDNGNVGFGIIPTTRNFQINKDINNGNKFAVSNPNIGSGAFSQFTVESKGNTGYLYSINDTYPFSASYPWFTPANTLLQSVGNGGLSLGATQPGAFMNFFTGGNDESMRISAAGNIGIGTKNPLQPMHISGSSASILLERFGIGSHFVGRTANGTQAAPTPLLANEIATRLSGNGYNGSNYWPVGTIDIMSEENQTPTTAGGFIKFQTTNAGGTSSSEKIRITSNGNVGVNTITPTEKLDVAGNMRFSGALMPNNLPGTAGQVLTSAGAGVAPTWDSNPVKPYVTTSGLSGVYNVLLSQYTVRVFGGITNVVLPTPVGNLGKTFVLIGSNGSGSHSLTTAAGIIYDDFGPGGFVSTINQGERVTVQSDGVNWIVIGR